MTNEVFATVTQDSKNMAMMLWIGTIFFAFIPGLIFFLIKKDDVYVQDQTKEALNWSITVMIAYFAVKVTLPFLFMSMLLYAFIGTCNLIFCIMGVVGASNGKVYRVPFTLRLIK